MRRPILLAALTVLSFALPAAAEEETYTIPARETWAVGDVLTKTEKDSQAQTVKGPDGSVINQGETVVEYTGVLKVLEVNAQGDYTKALVYFSAWSMKLGGSESTELTGKHVEITGAPTARTVTVLSAEVGEAATEWLQKEFAKKDEGAAEAAFTPKKPVAIGESWSPEFSALEKVFGGADGMKLDAEKSKATITLEDVEDDVATLVIDFALQTANMQTPQGPMSWSEGGVLEMKATGTKSLKPGGHAGTGSMTGSLKGAIDAGGATITLEIQLRNESKTTLGGTMPAAPAPK